MQQVAGLSGFDGTSPAVSEIWSHCVRLRINTDLRLSDKHCTTWCVMTINEYQEIHELRIRYSIFVTGVKHVISHCVVFVNQMYIKLYWNSVKCKQSTSNLIAMYYLTDFHLSPSCFGTDIMEKMHAMVSDGSSRAENWTDIRKKSMCVFFN